jgi:hypothetical protein
MDERVKTAAIDVMGLISAHQVANDFLEPAQQGSDDPPDLPTITSRLRDCQYASVQAWLKDVESIWANAETVHGRTSPQGIVANECRRLFDKYRRKVDILAMGTWSTEVYRLRTRVSDLIGQPPSRVKQYSSSLGAALTMKQNMPPFSEKEIQHFVAATEMMVREEDQTELIRIIDEMHPEIDSGAADFSVDVSKINLPTLYAMRDYMKSTLEKRGEKYPD